MRPAHVVVFDGQSLNIMPVGNTYPALTMAGRGQPWSVVGIAATSFTQLATTAASRVHPLAKPYAESTLVLCGGTSDLSTEGDSAATVLSDMVAYAAAARTAGFTRVIALTITPSTGFSAGANTQRLTANALILASAAFDEVVDVAGHPSLDDATDVAYYSDGTHWTTAGATIAAGMVAAVL